MPRLNSHGFGNHYVHVKIKPPTKLTDSQRALLLAFAETENLPSDSTVEGLVKTEKGKRHVTLNLLLTNLQFSLT